MGNGTMENIQTEKVLMVEVLRVEPTGEIFHLGESIGSIPELYDKMTYTYRVDPKSAISEEEPTIFTVYPRDSPSDPDFNTFSFTLGGERESQTKPFIRFTKDGATVRGEVVSNETLLMALKTWTEKWTQPLSQ